MKKNDLYPRIRNEHITLTEGLLAAGLVVLLALSGLLMYAIGLF